MISKSRKLKEMISSDKLEFLMECHNGMSAKIAEEAGFKGLWISGLSLSASSGVRDNNELSFKEVADMCGYICDRVKIPALLDMDTGYGDFNTARVALRHIMRAGVAGVCIEDKKFPKTNSFLANNGDDLADIEEHALKIKAIREEADAFDKDLVIVARLESFIAGTGLNDAVVRAKAYADAGADAILAHSKLSTSKEIDEFMAHWTSSDHSDVPVVIVPTKYYTTPTAHFRELGISMVIWANHNMRASIAAMQNTSKKIFEEESLTGIEDKIVSVSEVFRLQNNAELEESEKKYLPGPKYRVVIIGATRGSKFGEYTKTQPKMMIPIGGKRLVDYQIDNFKALGVDKITLVAGYGADVVKKAYKDLEVAVNTSYDTLGEIRSVHTGMPADKDCGRSVFVAHADLMYKKSVITDMMDTDDCDIVVAVTDRVIEGYMIEHVGSFVGVVLLRARAAMDDLAGFDESRTLFDFVLRSASKYNIKYVTVPHQSWADINDIADFEKGYKLI